MRALKFATSFAVAVACLLVAGCETMPSATYSNLGDNTYALRKFEGAKVRVATINDQSSFDSSCRLMGPIKTSGNRSLADFIRDSFNDELKFAGIFSDDQASVQLVATLHRASFSSTTGLTGGRWDFSLQVANPSNGRSVITSLQYDFDSGFIGDNACRNVANAITPSVQRLINRTISDPGFAALIGK